MDNRCSYDTCPKPSLLKGLCEQHYLVQFVQPLQKERRNLEDALAILNASIADYCQQLHKARHPNGFNDGRMLRQRPDGAYTNTAMVFCHKCWKPFDGAIECMQHEEVCRGDKPRYNNKGERHHANRAEKVRPIPETLIDDAEVNNDI